jgi:hypothetical protein
VAKQSRSKAQDAAEPQQEWPIGNIPLDELRTIIFARMEFNVTQTLHPFHHKTADGTVVDEDPTLLHLISRLTDAAPAVPVDRMHYGYDHVLVRYPTNKTKMQ